MMRDAYKGLIFGPATLKVDGKMEIVPPKDYDEQQLPRVHLEKSCVHLAQLLNSVKWK